MQHSQPSRHRSNRHIDTEQIVLLARRWGVGAATILKWHLDNSEQLRVLNAGRIARKDSLHAPSIGNLSLFAQQHGIFIKDIVRLAGVTRQTLNRLNRKQRSRCRLHDLIAGTEATLAASGSDSRE